MLNRSNVRVRVAAALALLLPTLVVTVAWQVATPNPAAAASSYTFTGGGFGHGVGMSQYGARGAARAGLNSTQILQHYYTGASVGTTTEPGDLRVRIGSPSTATVASIAGAGSGEITLLVGGAFVGTAPRGTVITMSAGSGQVAARIGDGPAVIGPYAAVEFTYSGSIVQIGPGGARFDRGVVVARPNGSTVQINIDRLSMTEYLYGLSEMPSSWEMPALEAQAVAGRSYAIVRRRGPGSSFDLESSTVDQVYAGYEKAAGGSFDRWKAAVDNTAGRVVKAPDGAVANTLYSSSHGGISEDNDYVFGGATSPGTPVSYLRSVNDPYEANSDNPLFRWNRTYTSEELGAWFGVAPVTDVRFAGPFGRSGRIDRAQVTLVSGGSSKTVRGDAFRRTINNNVPFERELLSTLIILEAKGSLDGVGQTPGGIIARGWAWDPTTEGATSVDVYVDGRYGARGAANLSRPDVGAAVPGAGSNRGYAISVPASGGSHQVCAYAITSNGVNPSLGCRSVTVRDDAVGNVDSVRPDGSVAVISGWALDFSQAGAIPVHAHVDGRWAAQATANTARPDVGDAFPGYGPNHGFEIRVPVGPGSRQACIYAIDDRQINPLIECVALPQIAPNQAPIGNLETAAQAGAGKVRLAGWALDPDTTASVTLHVYLGGPPGTGRFGAVINANLNRPDVGAAYPGKGNAHGFDATIDAADGEDVYVYIIDDRNELNPLLESVAR